MDRLLTGMYNDTHELARVMGALGGFVGFELFHVVSVTTDILFSDMAAACSSPGSSARFSRRFASYEVRL
jgi:hypothetical protein